MSSGFGGFGGFGQNSNQQSTGFGGFGSGTANNQTSGFGATNSNAFGSNTNTTTGGGLFGSSSTGGGGFGSGGAFGSNNSAFGAKPAFGSGTTTTGGLFGSTTPAASTSTFGGGGFGSNATSSSTPFSSGSSTLFGGNKGFGTGTANTSGSTLFGSGGTFGGTTGGTFSATANPGIGTNIGDPPGTGLVPYQATVEKEPTNSSQSNKFESILFMEPYKKWSGDELRLADYAKGQKTGTAGGTGAFGGTSFGSTGFGATAQNTGFGGNTTSSSGLFGNNQPTTSGFGSTTTATGGFGSGGGGLFGQNKPATGGGLFGSTSQPAQTGGIFGSGTGTGGFGSTASTGTGFGSAAPATGGGVFGSTTDQNKPSGFSFGQTGTTSSGFGSAQTGSAFGGNQGTANTGSGMFGGSGSTGGGLFGNAGQQATTGGFGSSFGAQAQNQGNSLFGNQQKPGGMFGGGTTSNTGGGLFGNANSSQSPFGGGTTAAQPTGGGIFGAKPNTTSGTGLFGNATANQTGNSGGGLFGNLGASTQNQQGTSSGLFGSLGQSQQQKPSIFTTSNQPAAGGMFGNNNNQQGGGGIFGGSLGQQQPQASGLGSSIFGTPQNAQSTPQSLSTSINDISAYGSTSLFSNLGSSDVANPGPLATPLSGNLSKARSRSILPMYKLSPANSSAFVTPQRRGFGFSYSNYGTPNSPSSVASTPSKFGQSMLVGSIGRGLNKSISASNLRRSYNVEDSILPTGAFSASSGPKYYSSTGSHKKLIINREMRSDLFTSPSREKQVGDGGNSSRKLTKRVSFETSTAGPSANGADGEGQPINDPSTSAQDLGYLRPSGRSTNGTNGTKAANLSGPPEMEQVRGNELAIVHEEESPVPAPRTPSSGVDREAGAYWMRPSREEIENMNRVQRQKVSNFTVGRENVGSIEFKFPVDLSNISLDELFGGIVDLVIRSATVYPNPAKKPPVGKGLNVPAIITLEQSWPRDRSKKKLDDKAIARLSRHVEKLKKIPDTIFESYDKDTGVWRFSVEHFTTYGLDDDDDDGDEDDEYVLESTEVVDSDRTRQIATHASGIPDLKARAKAAWTEREAEDVNQHRSKRRAVPGAFDGGDSTDDDENEGPVDATYPSLYPEHNIIDDATRGAVQTTADGGELDPFLYDEGDMDLEHAALDVGGISEPQQVPGGILRARMKALKESSLPQKIKVTGGDDWTEALRKRVNSTPRTDRAALRAMSEQVAMAEAEEQPDDVTGALGGGSLMASSKRVVSDGQGFATSIDLMNSLFDKAKASGPRVQASPARGFLKWPYKRQTHEQNNIDTDATERQFRRSLRPNWGPDGTLVYGGSSAGRKHADGQDDVRLLTFSMSGDASKDQFVHIIRLAEPASAKLTAKALEAHVALQPMALVKGVPTAATNQVPALKAYFDEKTLQATGAIHEKNIWEVASILFDDAATASAGPMATLTDREHTRRTNLSAFWEKLVEEDCTRSIALAKTTEEKAVAALSGRRVEEACKYLLEGRNYRLATLVALIGTSHTATVDLQEQVKDWKESNAMSEISEPIRALYELLAGNVCLCGGKEGKQGASIENRVTPFIISQRFALNWKQAFGLRLWYGATATDDISGAVDAYSADIELGREPRPQPWYIQDGAANSWKDSDQAEGEDEMWSLLQLYANKDTDPSSALEPRNVSLTPFDSRLSWQLGQALVATGKFSLPQHKADAATLALAEQLTAEGHWVLAIWALSHLSAAGRARAIQAHLARYAGRLCRQPAAWKELRGQAWLPRNWAYESLALYVRAVEGDGVMELELLRKAGNYREAHRALVTKVGPQAVIDRDYGLLRLADALARHTVEIPEWGLGGALYAAYRQFWLSVQQQGGKGKGKGGVRLDLVDRLLEMLRELKRQDANMEIAQRAALHLMSVQLAEVRQDVVGA